MAWTFPAAPTCGCGGSRRTSSSARCRRTRCRCGRRGRGLPRAYYVDRGAAYVADSLRTICADLGVQLIHTKARDPEAKGALEELNAALWAWLGVEYHANMHSTTGRAPGLHFESELAYLRPVPEDISLRDVFLHRALRLVRKDGCVSLDGVLYEVPGDLVGERVELRFDPRQPDDLPLVFHRGAYRDVARLLDRHANANGRRRALPTSETAGDDQGIDAIGLIADEYYRTLHGAPNRHADNDDDSEDGAA